MVSTSLGVYGGIVPTLIPGDAWSRGAYLQCEGGLGGRNNHGGMRSGAQRKRRLSCPENLTRPAALRSSGGGAPGAEPPGQPGSPASGVHVAAILSALGGMGGEAEPVRGGCDAAAVKYRPRRSGTSFSIYWRAGDGAATRPLAVPFVLLETGGLYTRLVRQPRA